VAVTGSRRGLALEREAIRSLFGLLVGVSSNQGRASPTWCKPKSADGRSELGHRATAIGAQAHQLVHYHEGLTPSALSSMAPELQVTIAYPAER
jgi:hypothetical protein